MLRKILCWFGWHFKPMFAWYDLWIGVFWDKKKKRLYIFPIPTIGILVNAGPVSKWRCKHGRIADYPRTQDGKIWYVHSTMKCCAASGATREEAISAWDEQMREPKRPL